MRRAYIAPDPVRTVGATERSSRALPRIVSREVAIVAIEASMRLRQLMVATHCFVLILPLVPRRVSALPRANDL